MDALRPPFFVDWDGTLATEAWPGLGQWLPGAVAALERLSGLGDTWIYSCRVAPVEVDGTTWRDPVAVGLEVRRLRRMLNLAGLHRVGIWTKPWKPRGHIIDDRCSRFTGDWDATLEQIAQAILKEVG